MHHRLGRRAALLLAGATAVLTVLAIIHPDADRASAAAAGRPHALLAQSRVLLTGRTDSVVAVTGGIRASGWSVDRRHPRADVEVDVRIGSLAPVRLAAVGRRADVARAHPAYGASHGWQFLRRVPAGTYRVCVTAVTNPAHSFGCRQVTVAPIDYVALGDSYTSGLRLSGSYVDASCYRSSVNYPHLTARALGLALHDASCSSAHTSHLTTAQSTVNSPQEDRLSPATRVVSVLYGLNDIGFGDINTECPSTTSTGPSLSGPPTCREHYTQGTDDTLLDRVATFRTDFLAALHEIHTKAPHATVFVLGYESAWSPDAAGCWAKDYPLQDSDTRYLAGVERALVAAASDDAALGGDRFLDLYTPSLAHTPCAPVTQRWVAGYGPGPGMHPTNLGHQEAALRLEAAISRSVILH